MLWRLYLYSHDERKVVKLSIEINTQKLKYSHIAEAIQPRVIQNNLTSDFQNAWLLIPLDNINGAIKIKFQGHRIMANCHLFFCKKKQRIFEIYTFKLQEYLELVHLSAWSSLANWA